jgi:hypothetical protein
MSRAGTWLIDITTSTTDGHILYLIDRVGTMEGKASYNMVMIHMELSWDRSKKGPAIYYDEKRLDLHTGPRTNFRPYTPSDANFHTVVWAVFGGMT